MVGSPHSDPRHCRSLGLKPSTTTDHLSGNYQRQRLLQRQALSSLFNQFQVGFFYSCNPIDLIRVAGGISHKPNFWCVVFPLSQQIAFGTVANWHFVLQSHLCCTHQSGLAVQAIAMCTMFRGVSSSEALHHSESSYFLDLSGAYLSLRRPELPRVTPSLYCACSNISSDPWTVSGKRKNFMTGALKSKANVLARLSVGRDS